MVSPEELNAILDRIAAGNHTAEDLVMLRHELTVSGDDNVVQLGKYNINIGQGQDIQVGDRIYQGPTAEVIQTIVYQVLDEYHAAQALSVTEKTPPIIDPHWLTTHVQRVEEQFASHMHEIEKIDIEQATKRYVELLVQVRIKLGDREQGMIPNLQEGPLSKFALLPNSRWLVFGEGGSGKTTSLLKLAAETACATKTDPDAPIPLYVKLNFFDSKANGFERLLELISNTAGLSIQDGKYLWLQDQHPFLFLLDGFNEIGKEHQQACTLALQEFIQQKPHCYIVTSRPTAEAETLSKRVIGIKELDILQLHDEQMQSFLEQHNASELYERIDSQLKELVQNPLMLWALIQSCVGLPKGELPRNKGQLYQNFIDRYIFSEHEVEKNPSPTKYNYSLVKKPILAMFAHRMTQEGSTRLHEDRSCLKAIIVQLQKICIENEGYIEIEPYELMPHPPVAKNFLNEVVHNGILQRTNGSLEFMHQSVQNYFAAIHLAMLNFSHADFQKCLDYISWKESNDTWDEVMIFLAGITSDLNQLIGELINRDHYLAASCAAMRPEALSTHMLDRLIERIIVLDLDAIESSVKYFNPWWEKVIHAYQQALLLVNRNADKKAIIQSNLGLAYTKRIVGKLADNFEKAIQYCQASLEVFTRERSPEQWASIRNNLGNAFSKRIQGSRAENLEQAINSYQLSLGIRTRESFPMDWAKTMVHLGNAYRERIRGDRAQNIEDAIAAYMQALQVRTREVVPVAWAETMMYLGNAYRDRICGDRAQNLEEAINAYEHSLQMRTCTEFPYQWAETMMHLGNAYRERIRGDRAQNIEDAIYSYQHALQIRTQVDYPVDWAEAMLNLGNAYRERICGDRAQNIEDAIYSYQHALQIRTQVDYPYRWAEAMMHLGNAYRERIQGDRSQNIEEAITAYHQALQVRTQEAMPVYWAELVNNIATAYLKRIRGDRAQNIEAAINYYHQALQVRSREAMPVDWAESMNKLATAYRERGEGEHAQNIEVAIDAYHQALKVRSLEAIPIDWAESMDNLATAYLKRIRGDRAQNIEKAINAYHQALQVRTQEAMPVDWAKSMNNLATAYQERIQGDRSQNIEEAIKAFEKALEVFQPEQLPNDCRRTAHLLGDLYSDIQCWSAASMAYQSALQAMEILYQSSLFRYTQEAELSEGNDLYRRAAFALAQAGDFSAAVVTLERARARGLSDILQRDRTDLAELATLAPDLYQDYQMAVEALRQLEIDEQSVSVSSTADQRTLSLDELRQRATTIRDQFRAVIGDIRQLQGYSTFLTQPDMEDIVASIRPDHPLIYLVTTPNGSLALITQTPLSEGELPTAINIHPIWLNDFTEPLLRKLLGVSGEGRSGWFGAYSNQHIDPDIWLTTIDQVTHQLWDLVMGPVLNQLAVLGVTQAVLIPMGYLSFLPLHAAWTEDDTTPTGRRYALDIITFTYAPNARSLRAAQDIAERISRQSLLAIKEPRPTRASILPNSEREVESAISYFPQHQLLSHEQATREMVLAALPNHTIVHVSTHGYVNFTTPLESGLLMANDELLTLRDLLNLQLPGVRLAVLSACETGLSGLHLPDEVLSFSTGLLQAGVAGVTPSLWSLPDLTTVLLLLRFYELWRVESLNPPEALRQAQQWVRDTTNGKKASYFKKVLPETSPNRMTAETAESFYMQFILRPPEDHDFAHPFYWAAFIYVGV